MKLNLALVAAVAAEWNGQSLDSTCGMQISGDSMVNSTCTVSGSSIKAMYAGNGAFITGANTFTGFDGISGDADVVVFFNQNENADGSLDNSTCWDAAVSCVDNGAATAGVFFMETVNAAAAGVINLQIAGVSANDVVSIELNDDNGNNVALTNITSAGGAVSAEEANGAFSVTAGENFGDLLQVSVNAAGVVNLWLSSVSN